MIVCRNFYYELHSKILKYEAQSPDIIIRYYKDVIATNRQSSVINTFPCLWNWKDKAPDEYTVIQTVTTTGSLC